MVRGFALFGVLLVNLYGFGADSVACRDEQHRWDPAIPGSLGQPQTRL